MYDRDVEAEENMPNNERGESEVGGSDDDICNISRDDIEVHSKVNENDGVFENLSQEENLTEVEAEENIPGTEWGELCVGESDDDYASGEDEHSNDSNDDSNSSENETFTNVENDWKSQEPEIVTIFDNDCIENDMDRFESCTDGADSIDLRNN